MAHTSIGRIFQREIFICKLLGGFMFDWPPRWLAISYRIFMILAIRYIASKGYKATQKSFKSLPTLVQTNLTLYFNAAYLLSVTCLIRLTLLEIQHHNVLTLILRKRIDTRYFKQIKMVQNKATINGGLKSAARCWLVAFGQLRTPSINLFRSVLIYIVVFDTIITYCRQISLDSWSNAERGRLNQRGYNFVNYTSDSLSLASKFNSSKPLSFISTNKTTSGLEETTAKLDDHVSPTFGQVLQLCFWTLLTPIIRTAHLCQLQGFELLTLSITASMADALESTNEQEELNLRYFKKPLASIGRSSSKPQRLEMIPSTQLLVQVRDVLVVLRQIGQPSHTINYVTEFAWTLGAIGFALALMSADHPLWALYYGINSVWIMMKLLLRRIVFRRLHVVADTAQDHFQRQLIWAPNGVRRVELVTNVKLAEEITQIWPTDWISYDIKSFFLSVLSAFAFMVSFHKMTEVTIKAMQRGGRGDVNQ